MTFPEQQFFDDLYFFFLFRTSTTPIMITAAATRTTKGRICVSSPVFTTCAEDVFPEDWSVFRFLLLLSFPEDEMSEESLFCAACVGVTVAGAYPG